jgi:hypothetical protein
MQDISTHPRIEIRALIGLASQIARRGYGEPVIELALRRKGVSREIARLIAASVVNCHAAIVTAQEQARIAQEQMATVRGSDNTDLRAARAASLALSKIGSFLVFGIAGIGGGVLLGWSMGFNRGLEDGFDWIVRAIERLVAG